MDDEQPNQTSARTSRRSFGPLRELETNVSVHVFTVSAAMVGVCLTVIGIIRVSLTLNTGYSTLADDLLDLDAFCFMGRACSPTDHSAHRVTRAQNDWNDSPTASSLPDCSPCVRSARSSPSPCFVPRTPRHPTINTTRGAHSRAHGLPSVAQDADSRPARPHSMNLRNAIGIHRPSWHHHPAVRTGERLTAVRGQPTGFATEWARGALYSAPWCSSPAG